MSLLTVAALAATLTVNDYATMPAPSSPRFSPDGKRIVYVVTRAVIPPGVVGSDVWVTDADGKNGLQLTHSRGADAHPRWSPDGSKIAFLSDREGPMAVWLIDTRGGDAWRLTEPSSPIREMEWSPDGKAIAFTMNDPIPASEERKAKDRDDAHVVGEGPRQAHLYRIDVSTREVSRLTHGAFSVNAFSWSPDGKTVAIERTPGDGLDNLYKTDLFTIDASVTCQDNSCPKLTPLVVRPGVDRAPRFSPDGKSVAFLSTGGTFDWVREHELWVVDLAAGQPRLVSAEYGRSPESFSWAGTGSLVFDGPMSSTAQLFSVGAGGSGLRNVSQLEGVVADSEVEASARRAVFVLQSLTAPPEVFVSPLDAFAPRQVTHHNDSLRSRALAPTRVIRWKNPKDGLEIEGLLTLPVSARAGVPVPLLTFVHGGPASRFDQSYLGYLGFLYAPQVLASKGFAVLRPNPRGTGGYGAAFRQANRSDWGGMDWLDINAGIDTLIANGIADPARLGLMGWSYGGFMASWALGHSDRFKAVSIGAPVVDLLSFHGTTDIRGFVPGYFPPEALAAATVPAGDAPAPRVPLSLEELRAHSPLWQLTPTKAHVLIQHGEADERVPPSQGTMLYRVLDELGADVSMVTYPRAGHVPREPKQRMDVMQRNVEFFEKWVK